MRTLINLENAHEPLREMWLEYLLLPNPPRDLEAMVVEWEALYERIRTLLKSQN